VAKTLKELNKPFVLMGDLNVVGGDDGVEGGLALEHWKNHPGCDPREMSDFADLRDSNDLVDIQKASGVKGFSKVCGCTGGNDVRGMTIDFVLASRCLYEDGWVTDFVRENHIATSDHLPQTVCINESLFPKVVNHIPLSKVAEEHEQHYGSMSGITNLILQELGSKVSEFFMNERAVGTDYDDVSVHELLQESVQGAWEFIRRWDPNETGVVSCEKINELFSAVKDKKEERQENFVDVCDAEIITSMDIVARQPKSFKIQTEVTFGESKSQAMFDSGSTRSLVSKETLDKHLGKQVADEVVRKDGYMPYFELADKSVVQGLGQATLQF
jgi:hypothetical protein